VVKNTDISKKKLFSLIAVIMAVSLLAGIMLTSQSVPTVKVEVASQTSGITGTATLTVYSPNHQIISSSTSKTDPLTNTGSSYIISMIANTSVSTKAVYLTLSTDASPLVTWTKLPNELTTNGLGKSTAITPTYGWCTTASGQSQYMLVTFTWSSITGTQAGIICIGLGYIASASANDLVCALAITSASVIAGDSLQGTVNMTCPCG